MLYQVSRLKHLVIFGMFWLLVGTPGGVFGIEILTMGDSITVGMPYFVSGRGKSNGAYQNELERILRNKGISANAYNWGKGGEMTTEGVNRISEALRSRAADLILIMEGANDVKGGVSSETVRTNIYLMARKSLQYGITPIIGTITPDTRENRYDVWTRDIFNPKIASVAAGLGVSLADQYAALRPGWETIPLNYDRLHPNYHGYQFMADRWYATLPIPMSPITGGAEKMTAISGILTGSVIPNNSTVQVYFQYGPDTGYGFESTHDTITASSSNTDIRIAIEGLKPFKQYHYRLVAANSLAIVYGNDQMFRTPGALPQFLLLSQ